MDRRRIPRMPAFAAAMLVMLMIAHMPAPAAAQSLLTRSPNLAGTWVGSPGMMYFTFMHRFSATDNEARDVSNTPTFLLGGTLPGPILVGAHYATQSALVRGFPNEWEFFARYSPIRQSETGIVDLAITAGYNQAAKSFDGELALGRKLGPLRLLVAARGFTNAFDESEARAAVAAGATFRVTENVALAADIATMVGARDNEHAAWSGGVQLRIPTTPHTLSLHASNTQTTTLEGASAGITEGFDDMLWGFEFTVPITLSRYIDFGSPPAPAPDPVVAAGGDRLDPGNASDPPVEVTMTNRLTFVEDTVYIQVGETVKWINTSALIHTVTADPEKAANAESVALPDGAEAFDSGNMAPAAVFTYTFEVPGTYKYFCIPHEVANMVGWVIVEDIAEED